MCKVLFDPKDRRLLYLNHVGLFQFTSGAAGGWLQNGYITSTEVMNYTTLQLKLGTQFSELYQN